MAVHGSLKGGDRIPAASPAQIPCCLGTCPLGVVGQSYAFDPGDDVVGTTGGGLLAQLILYLHATSGSRVVAVPTLGTYTAPPALTAVGAAAPAAVLGLTPGNTLGGAYDNINLALVIAGAGALGAAQASLSYDGTSVAETFTLPAEGPAALLGTVAITPTILGEASGTTFVFAAPAVATLTLPAGSLALSAAGLFAAVASVAAPVTVLAAAMLTAGKAALLANPRKLRFTTAGSPASDAPPTCAVVGTDYAGGALTETVTLSQTAGHADTVNAYATITSVVYAAADGTGATLAIGYADAYATVAELVAELTALAVAAPLAAVALDTQTAAGHFLGFQTTGAGTGVSLTFNASQGTGATLLGFTTAETATGTAATRSLPYTGLTLTFPVGAYTTAHSYSAVCVGPSSSVSALSTAAVAAHDAYSTNPFGLLTTTEAFATMANAKAAHDALSGLTNTWAADPAAPIYVRPLVGTALHTPSSVKATNDVSIAAADAAFLTAFPATTPDSDLGNVAPGDAYIPGAATLPEGTYRRPANWCGASKVAGAAKIAANPADGGVSGASLLAPDGLTRARNENGATTKLGQLGGPGAWVLKSTSSGLASPAFELCASRAGASSRLRDPGAVAIGREIQRLTFAVVEVWNGQTWEGDAANPIAANIEETEPRAHALDSLLGQTLRPGDYAPKGGDQNGAAPNNVTAFDVRVTAPTLGNDGKVSVLIPFNPLLAVGNVVVSVTATGAAITAAG
jgi:hypothetical protein